MDKHARVLAMMTWIGRHVAYSPGKAKIDHHHKLATRPLDAIMTELSERRFGFKCGGHAELLRALTQRDRALHLRSLYGGDRFALRDGKIEIINMRAKRAARARMVKSWLATKIANPVVFDMLRFPLSTSGQDRINALAASLAQIR